MFDVTYAIRQLSIVTVLAMAPAWLFGWLRARRLLLLVIAPATVLADLWFVYQTLATSARIWDHSHFPIHRSKSAHRTFRCSSSVGCWCSCCGCRSLRSGSVEFCGVGGGEYSRRRSVPQRYGYACTCWRQPVSHQWSWGSPNTRTRILSSHQDFPW